MVEINLWAAWIGLFLGMLFGAAQGLAFHDPEFLGGYAGWRRRLLRLGHVSFFGLAFVNLAFVFTVDRLSPAPSSSAALTLASSLFVASAVLMPAVCFASAWRSVCRHAFILPVGSLLVGVSSLFFWGMS